MQFIKKIGQYGIFIAFLGICLSLAVASPQFLTVSNWTIIITQVSITSLLAFGVTFVIISGGIDLSLGSVVALVGVVAALMAKQEGLSVVVVLMGSLAAGALVGLFNGIVITKSRIAPFIVTLGTMTIGRGLALILSKGRPVSNLSDSFNFIGSGIFWGIPFPIIVLILTYIICAIVLKKTILGRYIYAIGGNEQAALAAGIEVDKIKIIVYTLCGVLAGMGGILLTSRIATGQPNAGVGFELDAIAAAIIGGASTTGGVGSMTGTLVGALLLAVINNGLDLLNVSSYYQQVVMGAIIIGAVLLDSWQQRKR
ncbi:MAG: ABC transporter permease [Runella sp.]